MSGGNGSVSGGSLELQAGSLTMNITGTATVNKTTSGIVTLGGTNTYSGQTLVSNGALEFSNTGAWSPNSNIMLAGGAVQFYGTAATFCDGNAGHRRRAGPVHDLGRRLCGPRRIPDR